MITDVALDWLSINEYAFTCWKVDRQLLDEIAQDNATDDGREKVSRNDYQAALECFRHG
jgi:hypothetical protein